GEKVEAIKGFVGGMGVGVLVASQRADVLRECQQRILSARRLDLANITHVRCAPAAATRQADPAIRSPGGPHAAIESLFPIASHTKSRLSASDRDRSHERGSSSH